MSSPTTKKKTVSEKNLEDRLNQFAREHEIMSVKLSSPNSRGQPDRMFLYKGIALFMELKGTGKKATALQLDYIRKLQDKGFYAEVVDTFERGRDILEELIFTGDHSTPSELQVQ